MKKILCFALVLVLMCGTTLAETPFETLFDAARKLAFDTHNVTLSAEATFSYDGEVFKVMHALYQQDGTRSFLSYMLDTPDLFGETSTNGYIVLGLGSKSYAGDAKYGYYYDNPTKTSDTVLLTNNRTELQLNLARLLALSVEGLVEEEQNGNTYTFRSGALPELVNNAAYYTLMDYIQDNYYMDLFDLYDYSNREATVYSEDWLGMVARQYKALYNADMPSIDEIYENDTLYGRYSVAMNAAYQAENEAAREYDGGIVLLKADGSSEWYDSEESYRLAIGEVDIYYADWSKAFNHFYSHLYGETLTEEQIDYVLYSPNEKLSEAYDEFMGSMNDYYKDIAKQQAPEALSAVVMPDGSVKTFDYIISTEVTTWNRILASQRFAALKQLDATVTTDGDGLLKSFSGTVTVEVTDNKDKKHDFTVVFDCKADAYGTTSVPATFEPDKYGLISYDEFLRKSTEEIEYDSTEYDDYWETLIKNDPGTVVFGGVTYDTMLQLYATMEQ